MISQNPLAAAKQRQRSRSPDRTLQAPRRTSQKERSASLSIHALNVSAGENQLKHSLEVVRRHFFLHGRENGT